MRNETTVETSASVLLTWVTVTTAASSWPLMVTVRVCGCAASSPDWLLNEMV